MKDWFFGKLSGKQGRFQVAAVTGMALLSACAAQAAGAQSEQHGRKFKPLPPTAHIVVTVQKGFNGKPLASAAVVFHAVRDGHNDGNLEVKTDEEGKAVIDVIEIGSHLTLQVIAPGFATYAEDFDVTGPNKEMLVKMQRPRAQISKYTEDKGEAAQTAPGVQEPPHPKKLAPGATSASPAPPATATPPASGPPNTSTSAPPQ